MDTPSAAKNVPEIKLVKVGKDRERNEKQRPRTKALPRLLPIHYVRHELTCFQECFDRTTKRDPIVRCLWLRPELSLRSVGDETRHAIAADRRGCSSFHCRRRSRPRFPSLVQRENGTRI